MNSRIKRTLTTRFLTVDELSTLIGTKRKTLLQQDHRGKIDYVKKGNQLLFDKQDFKP